MENSLKVFCIQLGGTAVWKYKTQCSFKIIWFMKREGLEENPVSLKCNLQCGDHICHQLLNSLVNTVTQTPQKWVKSETVGSPRRGNLAVQLSDRDFIQVTVCFHIRICLSIKECYKSGDGISNTKPQSQRQHLEELQATKIREETQRKQKL